MANTYYDSQLDDEQIENALRAVNGVIAPANNGKVLAISNGKIVARSVQWGGGGGSVLEPLSVTENGDYYPESGVDGFDEVHVAVQSGEPNLYGQMSPFPDGGIPLAFGVQASVQSSSGLNGSIEVLIAANYYWEGFDIAISNLTVNRKYKISFTIQTTGNFVSDYPYDYTVKDTVSSTYANVYYDNKMDMDNNSHSYQIEFTATATTMYLSFSLAALDTGNHTVNLTNIRININKFTLNGRYEAPSGYDGYGDTIVDVQPPLQAKTATENGLIVADSGYYGLSQVTVNVSGGGGESEDIDKSFLQNSVGSKVIASRKIQDVGNIHLITANNTYSYSGVKAYVDLTDINTDVTCYSAVKCMDTGEGILICVPYANSNGNSPNFYTPGSSYAVECTVYAGNTRVPDITCDVVHVYALSINSSERKVRYFIDGNYIMEKTFNNSGSCVVIGAGDKNANSYTNGKIQPYYFGVVSELETDANIIANQQTIMQKLGIT